MLSDVRLSATNEQILHDSTYIRYTEQSESDRKQNGDFQGTQMKVYGLTGEKLHFGKQKCFDLSSSNVYKKI